VSQPTPLNRISSRDSTTRLKQLLSTRQGLQRWNIYSLTFLDSENSDGAKDTWCSPHCLNAVHEEAGDGYVHGKLKEDKLRRRCRGTSLQASSGGTRTSPRTEAWSVMQIGVLLSVFSRASSGGCRRRRRNSLLGEWAEQRQRWASGRLAKTSQRGKQEWRQCQARKQRDLVMATLRKGFPFYTSTETQRLSQSTEVGTSRVIRRWQHGAR
jgi:hypothetical protein